MISPRDSAPSELKEQFPKGQAAQQAQAVMDLLGSKQSSRRQASMPFADMEDDGPLR